MLRRLRIGWMRRRLSRRRLLLLANRCLHLKKYLERCSIFKTRSQALIGFPSQNQKLRSPSRMKPRVMVINRIPVTHPPRTIPPKKTKQKMNWREQPMKRQIPIPRPVMSYDHYLYYKRNQLCLTK